MFKRNEWNPQGRKRTLGKIRTQIEILDMKYIVRKVKNSIDKLTSLDD